MSEHEQAQARPGEARESRDEHDRNGADHPAQHAARHEPGGEEENHPQGETGSTTWDTEQHSDAPGPFGTG